jgi:hypothetical protein
LRTTDQVVLFIITANGFLPVGSGTTVRHNTNNTHHTQTKHSTQNYTNNKGHTTHNAYSANTVIATNKPVTTAVDYISLVYKDSILAMGVP